MYACVCIYVHILYVYIYVYIYIYIYIYILFTFECRRKSIYIYILFTFECRRKSVHSFYHMKYVQLCMLEYTWFSLEKLHADKFYEKFDIFGLTETWTSKDSNIILPGYRTLTVHATKGNRNKGRLSGGLIVYIREVLFKKRFCSKNKILKNNYLAEIEQACI